MGEMGDSYIQRNEIQVSPVVENRSSYNSIDYRKHGWSNCNQRTNDITYSLSTFRVILICSRFEVLCIQTELSVQELRFSVNLLTGKPKLPIGFSNRLTDGGYYVVKSAKIVMVGLSYSLAKAFNTKHLHYSVNY